MRKYVTLGLFKMMGIIIEKPTAKSQLLKDAFLETPMFKH
jgi:hypothetical protein